MSPILNVAKLSGTLSNVTFLPDRSVTSIFSFPFSVFVAAAFSSPFALQPINKKKIDKIAVNSVIDFFILPPLIDNDNH